MSVARREWETTTGEVHGAWVVRYRDADGKTRQGGSYDLKRDAVARDREIHNELNQGTHCPDWESITLRQAGASWLDKLRGDRLESTTIEGYERVIKYHINPATIPADARNGWEGEFGDLKLSKLKTPVCVAFQRQIPKTQAHNTNGKVIEGRLISLTTSRLVLFVFKAILTEAKISAAISINPAESLTIKKNDRDRLPLRIGHEIPDENDVRRILRKATGMWRVMFTLAAFTGMRMSEIRGLPWENVDFDKRLIHVWQRADQKRRIAKSHIPPG